MRGRPTRHWAHGSGKAAAPDASEPEDLSTRRRDHRGGTDNRGPATWAAGTGDVPNGTHRRVGLSPHRGRSRTEGGPRGALGRDGRPPTTWRRSRGTCGPRTSGAGRTSSPSATSRSTTTCSTPPNWSGIVAPRHRGAAPFAACRGAEGVTPLEMTKWFDTNYHYLVPELRPARRSRCEPRSGSRTSRRRARSACTPARRCSARSRCCCCPRGSTTRWRCCRRSSRGLRGVRRAARRGRRCSSTSRASCSTARTPSSTRSRRPTRG